MDFTNDIPETELDIATELKHSVQWLGNDYKQGEDYKEYLSVMFDELLKKIK